MSQLQQQDKIDAQDIKEHVNFYDLAMHFEEHNVSVAYDFVKMRCPFHEEKTASFFYCISKKFFYCYGCKKHGDVYDYVMHKNKSTFKDALDFILTFFKINNNISKEDIKKITSYKKELEALKQNQEKTKFVHFTEQDIETMIEFRRSLKLKTNFLNETLDFFETGFDTNEQRIVFPLRDEHGALVGATGRTIKANFKELKIPKWRHYKNSDTSKTFFNIKNGILFSKEADNSIIIVEGPKDVIWLHQNGFKNVIGCLTNNVSQAQKSILLKHFMTIYLFLDGDKGGEIGKSDILKKIGGYFNIFNVDTPVGKDPDELTKEELDNVIRSARKL